MLKGKRIFISGGAGVIGLELVPKLLREGASVFVGDLKPKPEAFSPEVRYRMGDLNELQASEIESFAPEIFIHLAATFERSRETYGFWSENFHHNVHLSHHLMTLLKDLPSLRRVVFASSYLIYDPSLYQFDSAQTKARGLKERDPISPRNLTGMAKVQHEMELEFLREHRGDQFSSVSARIFRGYGKGSRDIISRWIRSLLKGEMIEVYREEGLFDYIHASDSAEGLMRLAGHTYSGVINLGTGRARRVSEVIEALRKEFPGLKSKSVASQIPFEASECDTTLLRETLGWTPERSLEDAIPEMVRHEKESPVARDKKGSVLVTSISSKVPLLQWVRKASERDGRKVLGSDIDSKCLGSYFVDEFWKSERTSQWNEAELLSELKHRSVSAVIPTRDGELAFWAKNREFFSENGIAVMISDLKTVNFCLDKIAFFENSKGAPVIPSYLEAESVESDRLVVKERYGAGSRLLGIGISLEEAREFAKKLEDPIYQPFVDCRDGSEATVDLYVGRSGRVKGVVCRRRELVIRGESQVTTTFRDSGLESLCSEFVKGRGFYGHINLQVLVTSGGGYSIVECNPRFGGASSASVAVGLDSFYWFFVESNGLSLDELPFVRLEEEIRQIRYPQDTIQIGSEHGHRF